MRKPPYLDSLLVLVLLEYVLASLDGSKKVWSWEPLLRAGCKMKLIKLKELGRGPEDAARIREVGDGQTD